MSYTSKDIKNIVAEILEDKKDKGGVKSLYFVGCGGSLGALYPAKTFMEKECSNIKSAVHQKILERIRSSVCPAIREIHRKRLQQQSLVRKKEQQ